MFVLLDSNVWLAALAHDGFCRRVVGSASVRCTWVTTSYICSEVREKLITKFRCLPDQADNLVRKLASASVLKEHVTGPAPEVRDPDDRPILAAAVVHGCEFLVTGDADLLTLKVFSGVKIVSVREFAGLLRLPVR